MEYQIARGIFGRIFDRWSSIRNGRLRRRGQLFYRGRIRIGIGSWRFFELGVFEELGRFGIWRRGQRV